ncbi:hypothetical protein K2Q02_00605, partial [Patescibacteria group bacterium]|nr:hypothetical protein [Patescibacteria group bacterium]
MNEETMTSLKKAQIEVAKENPDLPMQLKFEPSPKETIDRLLEVDDLTLPTPDGQERNIIGKIFDSIVLQLNKNNFANVTVVRGNPTVPAVDNFDKLLFPAGNPGRSST